ncbi:hypothetical protein HanXRQr2_Chr06g0241801 [Helianthus annuus]|uniref:Uncharacterized protein n=1 Tax=Helianthus annuus TaxID=4232 RepID=A0A9K3NIK9_HELAN|nr:hypothetical protein HanXRQr2_Chr06g0241801 [Helianthus annuus]KAJ0913972.1 hypothetical protein HanPSC8_Chr06g0233361 [Helianthus annuus]
MCYVPICLCVCIYIYKCYTRKPKPQATRLETMVSSEHYVIHVNRNHKQPDSRPWSRVNISNGPARPWPRRN